jgi:hypothetical protein
MFHTQKLLHVLCLTGPPSGSAQLYTTTVRAYYHFQYVEIVSYNYNNVSYTKISTCFGPTGPSSGSAQLYTTVRAYYHLQYVETVSSIKPLL